MASHRDDPTATPDLLSMLASLPLQQEQGIDAGISQHGIPYRTLRAVGPDQVSLIAWARTALNGAIAAGATTLVLRDPPRMTIFENGRKYSKGLVMHCHVLPSEANAALPASSDGGPAVGVGAQD